MFIISDLHIKSPQDHNHQILLDFLNNLETDELFLLGDIFDFCFGASTYFHKKWKLLGDTLKKLSKTTKIHFFEGNHEFAISELYWEGVNFYQKDCIHNQILLSHGDEIAASWTYLKYKKLSRSQIFRQAGLLCPDQYLDQIALKISAKSRMHHNINTINHHKLQKKLFSWLSKHQQKIGIVGHYHLDYHLKNQVTGQEILCLPCWDQHPNALEFDGKKFYRHYLQKGEKVLSQHQKYP